MGTRRPPTLPKLVYDVYVQNFLGDQDGLSMRLRGAPKKPWLPPTIKKLCSLPTLKTTFNIASIAYNVLVKFFLGSW